MADGPSGVPFATNGVADETNGVVDETNGVSFVTNGRARETNDAALMSAEGRRDAPSPSTITTAGHNGGTSPPGREPGPVNPAPWQRWDLH